MTTQRDAIHWRLFAALLILLIAGMLAGCAATAPASSSSEAIESESASPSSEEPEPVLVRLYVPLQWDAATAYLVGHQGTTAYWGTCGECALANTLNLITGSSYTEADIVNFVLDNGFCDPASGGMSTYDMWRAYRRLLPLDSIDLWWYDEELTLSIDEMAEKIERGILLNVSVYGEMMREGGHTGEGDVYTTHWLVLHGVDRAEDGSVAGFWIADSASSMDYISAAALSDVYYGHDGTKMIDPTVIEVYGWRLAVYDNTDAADIAPPASTE